MYYFTQHGFEEMTPFPDAEALVLYLAGLLGRVGTHNASWFSHVLGQIRGIPVGRWLRHEDMGIYIFHGWPPADIPRRKS